MSVSIVQKKAAANAASAITLATGSFGSNVTSGNYLWIVTVSATAPTHAASKNSGTATVGTFTQQGTVTEAGTGEKLTHWTAPITGSGSLDILITYGTSDSNRRVWAAEIGGTSGPQVSNVGSDGGNNPSTSVSVTVASIPSLALMFGADLQGGTPSGAGSSWTNDSLASAAGGTWTGAGGDARIQTRIPAGTGSLSGNFANTSFDRMDQAIVVFTEGSVAPPASILSGQVWM